jgi:hypothetical protein
VARHIIELTETEVKEAILAAMQVKYPTMQSVSLRVVPVYDVRDMPMGIYAITAEVSE